MSSLAASALQDWVPLIAVLWLMSCVLLAVSLKRYSISRAAHLGNSPIYEPLVDAPVSPTLASMTNDVSASLPRSSAQLACDAVCSRVARDPASAEGLIELARALYLDGSKFTFQTLADLGAHDRGLASSLIEAWLADPSAVEEWQQLYEAVREMQVRTPPVVEPIVSARSGIAGMGMQ
ncbi:MAG TPA: hypothetical protein VNE58_11225 [Casimicrobiaceae bacterium]|nr:hypothetical protein [Casimicrobiaceae bacterium]